MNTELDRYGMTPEEREAFEREMPGSPKLYSDGTYAYDWVHRQALGWAACAKMYRAEIERLRAKMTPRERLEADLEKLRENGARLRAEMVTQERPVLTPLVWQPMETSPKNTTRVILWDGEDSEAFVGYFTVHHGWVTYPAGYRVTPILWAPLPEGPQS